MFFLLCAEGLVHAKSEIYVCAADTEMSEGMINDFPKLFTSTKKCVIPQRNMVYYELKIRPN